MMGADLIAELMAGNADGARLDEIAPGGNRHPAYTFGFWRGRDDAECSAVLRRFPRMTAAEARAAWAKIEAGK